MERVTIRVQGVGPIGFARVVTPCTLAQLREQMGEQLHDVLPPSGFRFVCAGTTVSATQEVDEDLMEGDVFVVALPSGSANGMAQAAVAHAPARSLLQQWVEAFGFM